MNIILRRNDINIDELCRALKLNALACELYGVHLMKALQWVVFRWFRVLIGNDKYLLQESQHEQIASRVCRSDA